MNPASLPFGLLITGRPPENREVFKRAEAAILRFASFFEMPIVVWTRPSSDRNSDVNLNINVEYQTLFIDVENHLVDANSNNGFKQISQLEAGFQYLQSKNVEIIIRTRLDVVINPEALFLAFRVFSAKSFRIWTTGTAFQAPNHLFDHLFMVRACDAYVPSARAFDLLAPALKELNRLGVSSAVGSHGWQFNRLLRCEKMAASVLLIELTLIFVKRGWSPGKDFERKYFDFWLSVVLEFYSSQGALISGATAHEFYPSRFGGRLSPACVSTERIVKLDQPINALKLEFVRSNLELVEITQSVKAYNAMDLDASLQEFVDAGFNFVTPRLSVSQLFSIVKEFVSHSRSGAL